MPSYGSRQMRSPMQHQFSQVPRAQIERSQFDRSFSHKTTFDAGLLIPVYVDEALPGDTFNLRMSAFARLATPLKPLMDNMYLDSFFFAVPYRLVWQDWERFNGAQDDPGDSTAFALPKFTSGNALSGTIHDYMGIPPMAVPGGDLLNITSLWHRAYYLIWNEWFRDQNLQNSLVFPKTSTNEAFGSYVLQRRGKRHDYFTSCLPFPQKGEDVLLPLGVTAPIVTPTLDTTFSLKRPGGAGAYNVRGQVGSDALEAAVALPDGELQMWNSSVGPPFVVQGISADLTAATAATINDLREAFQIQRLLERDARGGTRYVELVKSHFGVTSPDYRLQRPEYLGGGSTPVVVSPVAQTSSTDATTPQANLAAVGTVSVSGHGFVKSFTEHCLLLGLVAVRADITYQQGVERMFTRQTRFDFYWPALAHLGEQAVLNKEIFLHPTAAQANTEAVFGYQERYAEYRYKPSRISGLFRSQLAAPLDVWHLAQEFAAQPVLGSTFIVDDPPIDRVIAVPTEPHFLFDSYFALKCARPMPVFGVPGLIDHF